MPDLALMAPIERTQCGAEACCAPTGENSLSDNRDATINLPLIAAIVGVATIGGFMFGYDSGVINGTQEGLEKHLRLERGVARHHGQRLAARLRGRCVRSPAAWPIVWGRRARHDGGGRCCSS